MARFLQISIADPCHEDWDKMTDNEKGKFCGSCQKQVIDFSGMTDTQLVAFFKKKSASEVCGRLNDYQLDRGIPVPPKRIPWVRYFFQFTLPLFLTTLKAKAQTGAVTVKTAQTETCERRSYGNLTFKEDLVDLLVDEGIQIRGIVLNEEGQPVPFASIEKGLVGVAADSTGAFTLILAPGHKEITLKVSSVGYESSEAKFTREQFNGKEPLIIRLKKNILMTEVIVVGYGRTTGKLVVTGTVSTITHRNLIEPLATPSPAETFFRVYANPARANSNVFIDAKKSEEGSYAIQLLNISGQLIRQEQAKIEKGMGAISFAIPAIPSGSYVITLVNKKTGKKYSEKLIVQ
jgi:hypothetical protein